MEKQDRNYSVHSAADRVNWVRSANFCGCEALRRIIDGEMA